MAMEYSTPDLEITRGCPATMLDMREFCRRQVGETLRVLDLAVTGCGSARRMESGEQPREGRMNGDVEERWEELEAIPLAWTPRTTSESTLPHATCRDTGERTAEQATFLNTPTAYS